MVRRQQSKNRRDIPSRSFEEGELIGCEADARQRHKLPFRLAAEPTEKDIDFLVKSTLAQIKSLRAQLHAKNRKPSINDADNAKLLKRLEEAEIWLPDIASPVKAGAVGRLTSRPAGVLRLIDASDVLATARLNDGKKVHVWAKGFLLPSMPQLTSISLHGAVKVTSSTKDKDYGVILIVEPLALAKVQDELKKRLAAQGDR